MGLLKQHLNPNRERVRFDPTVLADRLREGLPEVLFGFLLGSAADGEVLAHSDLDLAFYLNGKPSLAFHAKTGDIVSDFLPGIRCDIGILNRAEPVYRFEALKGRLLFARDRDAYLTFYSRTCREYESQMAAYERQRRYRMEVANAV